MLTKRFAAYAQAFERAYESRDWSLLQDFLTEDASYEVLGPERLRSESRGRKQVLEFLDWVTDAFDRKCEERKTVMFDPLVEIDGRIELHAAAIYRLPSGLHCHSNLYETATFEGDRIRRLVDELSPGACHEILLALDGYPELFPRSLNGPAAS